MLNLGARAQAGGQAGETASFVEVENGKISYQECGSGAPTIVLIHDGIADSSVWEEVWPSICKDYHTIQYDRRGYGKSPTATRWYYESDDLAALLHHLKVSHAVLVGSSHGGELSIDSDLVIRRWSSNWFWSERS